MNIASTQEDPNNEFDSSKLMQIQDLVQGRCHTQENVVAGGSRRFRSPQRGMTFRGHKRHQSNEVSF